MIADRIAEIRAALESVKVDADGSYEINERLDCSYAVVENALSEIEKKISEAVLVPDGSTLAEATKLVALRALERSHGKKAQAAKALDVTRRTLYNWLREWNVTDLDQNLALEVDGDKNGVANEPAGQAGRPI